MKEIDFERAAVLLDVVAKCATVGPMYTSLSGMAGLELKEMNDAALENAKEIAAEREAKERDRLEAEAAAAREANDMPAERGGPRIYPPGSGTQETRDGARAIPANSPTIAERKV